MNSTATNFFRACRAPASRRLLQHTPSTRTPLSRTKTFSPRRPFSSQRCQLAQSANIPPSSTPAPPTADSILESQTPVSDSDSKAADAAFLSSTFSLTGHVSRVGTMRKTVHVSRTVQVWDAYLQKHYKRSTHDLVHDPHDILNEGDVITYGPFPPSLLVPREQKGQIGGKNRVRFVLRDVITPFGTPVDQRSPRVVGSPEGRWIGGPGQVQKVVVRARGKAKPKVQVPLTGKTEKKGGAASPQRQVA
ncbi:hypothetical protein LTR10_020915 [Elasticomyces elasticus]|uniref:Ribosomal protein S17 n=1 Tax=Exophiala sideris TaxID=1016849 RepID=A0ABR0JCI6_9EURO|nr:hypothetical protein LTR10_020915 [Elasticomyces elasticus]KAK5031127.1 hypothetical protein LTS07_004862 [Exophiala sideris]KAK5038848.1 hypothetical protein LTR13_003879 [Exophiala sideris]KAK5060732.1 hypothetical protein LTR69_005331 [Exophiala sideris]KAK5183644.1 hypothetical protein LTR44_003926 [Eurotiomycetes sp. CCFEE 6388]